MNCVPRVLGAPELELRFEADFEFGPGWTVVAPGACPAAARAEVLWVDLSVPGLSLVWSAFIDVPPEAVGQEFSPFPSLLSGMFSLVWSSLSSLSLSWLLLWFWPLVALVPPTRGALVVLPLLLVLPALVAALIDASPRRLVVSLGVRSFMSGEEPDDLVFVTAAAAAAAVAVAVGAAIAVAGAAFSVVAVPTSVSVVVAAVAAVDVGFVGC
mmetsp:Transcript_7118/g.15636  ORF Transcript_7118/g.15636 Transcript_7118/m.15636 type:complete len:212 (+) Transcript_7118:2534-3169(+)